MLACTTGGYWVPPKATDPPPADIAFLLEPTLTDFPALDPPLVETATPVTDLPLPQDTPVPPPINTTPVLYYTQAADTLPVVAVRFGVRLRKSPPLNPSQRKLCCHLTSSSSSRAAW